MAGEEYQDGRPATHLADEATAECKRSGPGTQIWSKSMHSLEYCPHFVACVAWNIIPGNEGVMVDGGVPSQLKCKACMPKSFKELGAARMAIEATEVYQDIPSDFYISRTWRTATTKADTPWKESLVWPQTEQSSFVLTCTLGQHQTTRLLSTQTWSASLALEISFLWIRASQSMESYLLGFSSMSLPFSQIMASSPNKKPKQPTNLEEIGFMLKEPMRESRIIQYLATFPLSIDVSLQKYSNPFPTFFTFCDFPYMSHNTYRPITKPLCLLLVHWLCFIQFVMLLCWILLL